MLGSLGSRLVAAFLAVSIVVLVAAGGALFVVLRGLHADATTASLPQTRSWPVARGTFLLLRRDGRHGRRFPAGLPMAVRRKMRRASHRARLP